MSDYCWACLSYEPPQFRPRGICEECTAPWWDGFVTGAAYDGPGVYVLRSPVGLVKIGMSKQSILVRALALLKRCPPETWLIASLPLAPPRIERWLHNSLCETRDTARARDEGLPCPTEWFWPAPAVEALIAGDEFVSRIDPEPYVDRGPVDRGFGLTDGQAA